MISAVLSWPDAAWVYGVGVIVLVLSGLAYGTLRAARRDRERHEAERGETRRWLVEFYAGYEEPLVTPEPSYSVGRYGSTFTLDEDGWVRHPPESESRWARLLETFREWWEEPRLIRSYREFEEAYGKLPPISDYFISGSLLTPEAWARRRERELRARSWRWANCEHVWDGEKDLCSEYARGGLVMGVDFGKPGGAFTVRKVDPRLPSRDVRCGECGYVFGTPGFGEVCPQCGSGQRLYPGMTRE